MSGTGAPVVNVAGGTGVFKRVILGGSPPVGTRMKVTGRGNHIYIRRDLG